MGIYLSVDSTDFRPGLEITPHTLKLDRTNPHVPGIEGMNI
jgi:hypothetical protein